MTTKNQNDGRGLAEAGAKPRRKRNKPDGANPAILKGKFFHSFEEGRVQWQGCILGSPSPGYYLVQLFSWLDGGPTNQQIIPFGLDKTRRGGMIFSAINIRSGVKMRIP